MPKGYAITDLSNGKLCPRCDTVKSVTEFYKDKYNKTGLQVYCKACSGDRHREWKAKRPDAKEYLAAKSREWRKNNVERSADLLRRYNYGIAFGTYAQMLTAQNGSCAICEATEAGGRGKFHVDHCHSSKAVRGLLCNDCNNGLGRFKDDIELLEKAILYLTKSRSEP